MKKLCFYFQVHQPYRLRPFHFFDIGNNVEYFDKHTNAGILQKVASKCYLPTNRLLLELIEKYPGRFKVSFSISGTAIDQFTEYQPEVLLSFQQLAETGAVEFLAETYAHSLSSLKSQQEFTAQAIKHTSIIQELFGQKPKVFRNTELIYSDKIGKVVHEMGFEGMLTEGANHILGWKSPNFLYCNSASPKLKLLLKNYRLSDDIAFRFSNRNWQEWPLTVDKYVHWLNAISGEEELINLFMDYETFGEHQWNSSGIFDFLQALPGEVFNSSDIGFTTPSEVIAQLQPVAALHVPEAISWADEERNLSAWLGNDLQDDAIDSLYRLEKKVRKCNDPKIHHDWMYLQTSDHFYYMCTKYFADGDVHKYFNPYPSPYEAFINYMNVLCDFEVRLNKSIGENPPEKENVLRYIRPAANFMNNKRRQRKINNQTHFEHI